ncbi:MAG: HAD family hydrolase [Clostridia bacterium]|nr:HAD family hydrolase [Clostridia bacterium]
MKEYSTIIWDFNGTIIDDVQAALASVNDMLLKRNQPTIDINRYYEAVDTPISRFYETVFLPGTLDFSDAVVEFDSGYEKHIQKNPVMIGAEEMLSRFQKMGKRQIIVSASNIDKITRRLSEIQLLQYFDAVLGRSDYQAGDKVFLAKKYFEENTTYPESCVVIGDCVADWQMSKELSCDCILNTKGHQSRKEFSVTDAEIIDNLTELADLIM